MVRETMDNQSEEILVIVLLAKEPQVLTVSLVVVIVLSPLRNLLTLDENTTSLAAHGRGPILDIESAQDVGKAGLLKITLGIRRVAEVDTAGVNSATPWL
jgi:hypothetical protein